MHYLNPIHLERSVGLETSQRHLATIAPFAQFSVHMQSVGVSMPIPNVHKHYLRAEIGGLGAFSPVFGRVAPLNQLVHCFSGVPKFGL